MIASVRFALTFLWAVFHFPLMMLNPGGRLGVWQFKVFMRGVAFFCGVRFCVKGEISKTRPLLMVGNHMSVIEFTILPWAFNGSFFGKAEIAKMPLVGIFAHKAGVQFIDRRPSKAMEMTRKIREFTERATWPMVIFPEGTSSNGSRVYPFKSSLFTIIEPQLNGDPDAAQFTIQPFVMVFRDKNGCPVSDLDRAQHYAYFDSKKTPLIIDGQEVKIKERSSFGQVFHVIAVGGVTAEIHLLPPPPLADIKDRKELAETLHKIVNDAYMKLK